MFPATVESGSDLRRRRAVFSDLERGLFCGLEVTQEIIGR